MCTLLNIAIHLVDKQRKRFQNKLDIHASNSIGGIYVEPQILKDVLNRGFVSCNGFEFLF